MRIISLSRVKPGSLLGQPVYGSNGRILLQAGVELTQTYIERLHSMGYTYIYIEDKATTDIEVGDTLPPEMRMELIDSIKTMYDRMSNPQSARLVLHSGELGRKFTELFKCLFDYVQSNHVFIVNLHSIYASDAFLYTHCMNVGLYSTVLGIAHGYHEEKVKQLGIGAMLHDIGKLAISSSILNKPGKLTPEERTEMERHCQLGYDMLIQQPDISAVSAHCALQHHEKYAGGGYPRGLKGDEIHEVGRLISVVDVFDAMTSNRSYRNAFLPHEALEYLYTQTGKAFDPQFVELFVKHINIYPTGLPVRLSNGLAGVVAHVHSDDLRRPIIRVLQENGQDVEPFDLDLRTHLNVVISDCGDWQTV